MIGYRHSAVVVMLLVPVLLACGAPAGSPAPRATPSAEASPAASAQATRAPSTAIATAPPASVSATAPATATPPATATAPATPGAAAWRQHETADAPPAREDHTWTLTADGSTAYLFGGRGADGPLNDLWAFDLADASWSQVNITVDLPVPAGRFGHTATWVPDVGLVMWSGQGKSGFFDDIWAFDPTVPAWRQLESSGAIPQARYGSCAALGPDEQLWVSHGFTADSGRFADTRTYDFATGTWADRTPSGTAPVKRCLHDCFWAANGELILYAGQTTGILALSDVWAFDPAAGSWTRGPEPTAPARQLYAMAPDEQGALIFGGGSVDGGFLADTWRLDADSLEMTQIDVSGPSARSGSTLIVEPASGDAWLFGGVGSDGLLGDTWVLSGAL